MYVNGLLSVTARNFVPVQVILEYLCYCLFKGKELQFVHRIPGHTHRWPVPKNGCSQVCDYGVEPCLTSRRLSITKGILWVVVFLRVHGSFGLLSQPRIGGSELVDRFHNLWIVFNELVVITTETQEPLTPSCCLVLAGFLMLRLFWNQFQCSFLKRCVQGTLQRFGRTSQVTVSRQTLSIHWVCAWTFPCVPPMLRRRRWGHQEKLVLASSATLPCSTSQAW